MNRAADLPNRQRAGGGGATVLCDPAADHIPSAGGTIPGAAFSSLPDLTPAGDPGRGLFLCVAHCARCGGDFVPAYMGAVRCVPCSTPKPRKKFSAAELERRAKRMAELLDLALKARGVSRLPQMTPTQYRLYRKLRVAGLGREPALAEALR